MLASIGEGRFLVFPMDGTPLLMDVKRHFCGGFAELQQTGIE